jgi:acyl-ACP thioesterase
MNNLIPEIQKETYPITSADIDFTKRTKVSSLTNLFIQSAWHHAESLGFGIDVLHKHECAWMLSRLQIRLFKTPSWNEMISIHTWPKGIHRLFYQRDFKVFTIDQSEVACGTSEWLIIELKTKRPKLIHADYHIFNPDQVMHAIDSPVPVLQAPSTLPEIFTRQVMYSDMDLNSHLTTTRYIDWMFDTFDTEFLSSNSCREVAVNFLREIPHNTAVSIARYKSVGNTSYFFEFSNLENNMVFFRGQLIF